MEKAEVSKDKLGQTVRLSGAIALPEDVTHVDVIALGRARLIIPVGEAWDSWFDGTDVTADFMNECEQPSQQEARGFELNIRL